MSETITFPQFSETMLSMLGFSAALCVLLPLIAVIFALFKIKKTAKPLLYGFLLYLVVQLVIIPPLGNVFLMLTGLADSTASSLLSLLIAVVEEGARYICLAYLMKNYRKWNDAFMFGLGYGVSGVLLSGAMSSFNDLITATAINSGAVYELDLASQQSFAEIGAAMAETPAIAFLMAGVDQCCLAIMSIALAILLMDGIKTNSARMLPAAMAVHMMVLCFPLILGALWTWGFLTASAFLLMVAGISIWYIVKSKQPDPGKPNFRII